MTGFLVTELDVTEGGAFLANNLSTWIDLS
jgi:hypothetical protein